MEWIGIKPVVQTLALPPGGPLVLAVIGLVLVGRSSRFARVGLWLAAIGVSLTWILSMPAAAGAAMAWLESSDPRPMRVDQLAQELRGAHPPGAIVIIGAGVRFNGRESPQAQTPNALTLERLAHGARLARLTKLPVLVSGGIPAGRSESEARTMARTLEQVFGVTAKWLEGEALDTAGNARESARMLREAGVQRVVLVTQAYHMRRARAAFEAAGVQVLAAPHGFVGNVSGDLVTDFLPRADAMAMSRLVAHETVGWAWYWVRRVI